MPDTPKDAAANQTAPTQHLPSATRQKGIVPMGVTIGLGVFALVLSLAGYGFRLLAGDALQAVIRHAMVVVGFFMVAVPTAFVGGATLMNKIKHTHIHWRNAWTLGWLISCVMLLSIMGMYS